MKSQPSWGTLVRAVTHGDTTSLAALLQPSHVNDASEHGDRLLHFAARAGKLEAVKALVEEFGADVNVPNKNYVGTRRFGRPIYPNGFKQGTWTPLMLTTSKSLPETLTLLHSRGALLTPQNKDGWNCLHLAAQSGSLPCILFILQHVPELVWIHARNGMVPVHVAAKHGFRECVEALMGSMVAQEIVTPERNQDGVKAVEMPTNEGLTALHLGCHSGSVETIESLLERFGANPFTRDKAGRTAVHHAAMAGQVHVLEFLKTYLLKHPEWLGDVSAGDVERSVRREFERSDTFDGFTPLHWAGKEGFREVIVWLTDPHGGGASKTAVDNRGRTASNVGK
ncbi:Ankyrin repeat domain-containing protein 16 [Rhizophlyctis rosea]|nr:Ankyrin repeat domain-containing protein 16 [Rhizophlyctis rosea]